MPSDPDETDALAADLIRQVEEGAPAIDGWVRFDVQRGDRWLEGPVVSTGQLALASELAAFFAGDAVALRGVLIGAPESPDDVLAYLWTPQAGWRDVWRRVFDAGVPYEVPVDQQLAVRSSRPRH